MKTTYHAQFVLKWSTAIVRLLDRLVSRIAAAFRSYPVRLARRNS